MYSLPEKIEDKVKTVKIDGFTNSKTKRTKKAFSMDNIDYLTQIVRNKNREIKNGGGKNKMSNLLGNNEAIEQLLSKKRTQKNRTNEISNMMKPNNNNTVEVDLKRIYINTGN